MKLAKGKKREYALKHDARGEKEGVSQGPLSRRK